MTIDPRDFLLSTDYEMDKIIYFKEQKITPDQNGFYHISHSLGFVPLITGIWSKYADFNVCNHFSPQIQDPNTYDNPVATVSCLCEEDTIHLTLANRQSGSQVNFDYYVRLIGFEPSNLANNISPTSSAASEFILNTDYNYLKLFDKGFLTPDQNGDITITHNLGYIPQALFWTTLVDSNNGRVESQEIQDVTMPYTNIFSPTESYSFPKEGVEINSTQIKIHLPNPTYQRLDYRIYYDQAL